MTGVAVKSGLLTRASRPPRQKPGHSVILTGIPTRTTAHGAAAGPQRATTIPVIDSFNPYVNWPLAAQVGGDQAVVAAQPSLSPQPPTPAVRIWLSDDCHASGSSLSTRCSQSTTWREQMCGCGAA
eukprot:364693-Chlamydomonas_euryale.AAC.13